MIERAFGCYEGTPGKWDCDVVAATKTNIKDESKSIDKPKPSVSVLLSPATK